MNFLILNLLLIPAMISCKNPEPETYLIPNGFQGKVNIIFNQKNGTPAVYENGRRVYNIPPNGILLTQFKDEYGFVNREYYYIDTAINNRKRLKILNISDFQDSSRKSDINEIGIFSDGTTGVYGNSDDKSSLPFQEFYVASFGNFDSFFNSEYKNSFKEKLIKIVGHDF